MAREPDPESRPISVAEILARGRADAEAAARAAVPPPPAALTDTDADDDSGGRRRRGGSGSLSVSDLTGEAPRTSDRPGSHTGRFSVIDAPSAPPSAFSPMPTPTAQPPRSFNPIPEPASPPGAIPPSAIPPSANPPSAPFTSRPAAHIPPAQPTTDFGLTRSADPFPRADPPRPTVEPDAPLPSEPPARREATPDWSTTEHPATRDINRGAIAERFRQTEPRQTEPRPDPTVEERTGIIPRYDSPAARSAPDETARPLVDVPDLDRLSPEEREREFERYRNFEDIPAEPDAGPASGRLFGRLRSLLRSEDRGPDEGGDPGSAPDVPGTPAWNRAPQPDLGPDESYPTDPAGRYPTDPASRYGTGSAGLGLHDQLRDSSDFDFARPTPERTPDPQPAEPARLNDESANPAADSPWSVAAQNASETVTWGRSGAADTHGDPDTEVVDLDRAHLGPYGDGDGSHGDTAVTEPVRAAGSGFAFGRGGADSAVRERPARSRSGSSTATESSPGRQWAILGAQVVAGLLLGVGLFLGFAELWRWNVYFALVLSAVVIFGLVTTVHVVRRSQDLVSTLLALGVGLIVTIGPLVLLAAGG